MMVLTIWSGLWNGTLFLQQHERWQSTIKLEKTELWPLFFSRVNFQTCSDPELRKKNETRPTSLRSPLACSTTERLSVSMSPLGSGADQVRVCTQTSGLKHWGRGSERAGHVQDAQHCVALRRRGSGLVHATLHTPLHISQ